MDKWIRTMAGKAIGCRPMELIRENCFHDGIAGRAVHLYRDSKERVWMAYSRWGWTRVATTESSREDSDG